MIKAVSFFMIFLLVIQTQSISILQTAYNFNTEYFISKCENKAKPQLKCNGKCQLTKSISKLTSPVAKSQSTVFVFSFEYLKSASYPIKIKAIIEKKSFRAYISKKISIVFFDIIIPPKINDFY